MSLFGKQKQSFGLDIGSSAVKAVQLVESGGGFRLDAFARVPLAPETISGGVMKDPPTVVTAIREAVATAGVMTKNAVISVSGRDLWIKKLPPFPAGLSSKVLADAIALEAEHHIPFPMDEVYRDWQFLRSDTTGTEVMLVAVKRSRVNEYVAVVEEAGLTPVVVDVDSFAIENQYELNNPESGDEAVALVDIGAAVMKTNVVRGGASLFARDIPFGGLNYAQAIAQRLGIPLATAEAAKQGQDVGVSWDNLVPALEAVSRELSLEIQRTFDYFASTTESERIGRLVLSGGCAKLPGLDQFLASSWGIPVELARPFDNIQVDPARFPSDELATLGPELAVAVGLGTRRPGDSRSKR
ncbi:MAG: type IV pilus assembly protein PilM [Candidatus Methylomirabilia bacterium]